MKALEELGLDPALATEADVKASFKKLAMQHHPDKGGDSELFRQAQDLKERALQELKHGETLMEARANLGARVHRHNRASCDACAGTGVRSSRSSGFQTIRFKCRKCGGKGWLKEN